MDAYRAAKLRLFETLLPRGGTAVLNADTEAFPAFAAAAVMAGQTRDVAWARRGQGCGSRTASCAPDGQRLTHPVDAGATATSSCRWPAPSRPPTPWWRRACASPRA